jgi:hypothetical protein
LIRKKPEGIAVIDLKDAYPTVMEDLQVYAICECLILFDEFLLYDIHVLIIALEFIHRTLWKELLGLLAWWCLPLSIGILGLNPWRRDFGGERSSLIV